MLRYKSIQKNQIKASTSGREHEEESEILKTMLLEVAEELNLDKDQIALAAINLAIS